MPIFGVFDGHGSEGLSVSSFCKIQIPKIIKKFSSKKLKYSEILKKAFVKVDNDIVKTSIDVKQSGSTAWVALIKEDQIYFGMSSTLHLANTGDSRAVLYQFKDPEGNTEFNSAKDWLVSTFSTKDHKPDVKTEKQRIIQKGGRVAKFQGEVGPLR